MGLERQLDDQKARVAQDLVPIASDVTERTSEIKPVPCRSCSWDAGRSQSCAVVILQLLADRHPHVFTLQISDFDTHWNGRFDQGRHSFAVRRSRALDRRREWARRRWTNERQKKQSEDRRGECQPEPIDVS